MAKLWLKSPSTGRFNRGFNKMILKHQLKNKTVLFVIFTVLLIGGVSCLFWLNYFSKPRPIACTQEAKLCPDGSTVGRTGPIVSLPNVRLAIIKWKSYYGLSLTQKYFSWKTTTNSHNFCVIENLNPTKEGLFPYYVWARCGEFIIRDGALKELSGSSGPVKIDYPNELSFYDLNRFSYESPGDGSQYVEDIKRIFPEQVQTRIFNFQQDGIDEINRKIEMAAVEWFSSDQVIGADNLWEIAKLAIKNCEVEQGFQAHSRLVGLTLKNGKILTAIEPKIDDIFILAEDPKVIETCGKIRIATE